MADNAPKLIKLRDLAYNQIQIILRFAKAINAETKFEAITVRRELLETRYRTFSELEHQLFDDLNYVSISEAVDETYCEAQGLLTQACAGYDQKEHTNPHNLNVTLEKFVEQQKSFYEGVNNTTHHVRLPKVNIEQFSGDYKNWASFHDLYTTTVHDSHNITDVHKLQILKGLLSGEAAALIRHIPVTANNYAEAWDKICNRYNKMTPIVTSLIQTFFDQKSCSQANARELRRVTESSDEIVRGLRALGPDAETRDPWLIHIVLNKIDSETKQLWANESVGKDFPKFDTLLNFLNKRCDALEICDATTKNSTKSNTKSFLANSNPPFECIACNQPHPLFKCPIFKNNSVTNRIKFVNEENVCGNCLKKGHSSVKCFSKFSCMICRGRHHTLLHLHSDETETRIKSSQATSHHISLSDPTNDKPPEASHTALSSPEATTNESTQSVFHALYSSPTTVLPTAVVHVQLRTGELQLIRALLDSGSQTSFVTESCAQRLGLKRSSSSISISGLASSSAGKTKGKIDMTIQSRLDKTYILKVQAHIINNITNMLPTRQISLQTPIVGLELADPQFFIPSKIDILLGADVFFQILKPEKRMIDGFPILQASEFGWLVAGTWNKDAAFINLHVTTEPLIQTNPDDVHQLLTKFWEVEEVATLAKQPMLDNSCELHYDKTTTRDADGRFIVKLPFRETRASLGKSFEAAHQRLRAMERKFSSAPEFCNEYKSFMNDYIALRHMTYIPWSDIPIEDDAKYYLPHHAVIKPSSSTTKLRVVFDASCKTSSGVSLNDILQTGPNIQTDLTTIILRFRKPAIAIVADLEKMYRQIRVTPQDANFQLILWRENQNEQLKAYKLNTVTYGTACAPYLAVKTLKKSTEDFRELHPTATHIINNDFYIDDLLTGCDNIVEAISLKNRINEILSKSGFNLRKWKSNSPEFLNSFSQHEIQNIPKLIEDDASIKTLGIMWNALSDTFSFKVQKSEVNVSWTKRKILSTASKVYDPLGWLAPTIIRFKILLQKIWLLNIEWDSRLPDNITNAWQSIYESLPDLESIQIPRCLTSIKNPRQIQLHAFCDASEAAYGTVLYLRVVSDGGEITTNIVCAKSKVAPIKQVSLPRLELCGAVLLCNTVKFCLESLAYDNIELFAWTDSMIVLHWLSDVPRRWKSFIGNRTAIILETIPRSKWHHIQSKTNPADDLSRGINPQALSKRQLWWHGPPWLSENQLEWPRSSELRANLDETLLEERSKYTTGLTGIVNEDDIVLLLLTKFSSWKKIRKIMVYILRMGLPKRRQAQQNRDNSISPAELNAAEIIILRNVQKITFCNELTKMKKSNSLPTNHKLSSLDPFIDPTGLLRVGGRLSKSSLAYSTKHPVIVPKNHRVGELIICDIHINHMHAGNSLTLSIVRSKYWIIGARYMIKTCIKSCAVCIRYRFHKSEQKMADLPAERCTQSRPFLKVGLDYAGPLSIKTSKRKTAPAEKAYVAVFVCLAIKAVHLEVVNGLDTHSFLASLKRFISRRGTPEQIWCDNGTNFVGANRELQNLKQQIIKQSNNPIISEFLLQKSIKFNFNPPHAPHFGGLWEASVKSFKYHLKRVTNTNLTFEEMTTLIIQIEALLNSRPLCRINDDPADLEILTPAHFLIGAALTAIPEPSLTDEPSNKLSRWQNIQQRLQGFWHRWHRDYLTSLQQRHKWKSTTKQFAIDDVVLIREDNLYPSQWMLGRVIGVHTGSDGIIRVVSLKTAKNEVKRPVNKLVKLIIKQ